MADSLSLLVTDTNIWIDLHLGGLLDAVFQLPAVWIAPDLVVNELAVPDPQPLIQRGLQSRELSAAQVEAVERFAAIYTQPSIADLSALVMATALGAMLLSGDGRLRRAAQQEGVVVHGTLWLLDEVVARQILTPAEAAEALQRMLDGQRRLPRADVEERMRRWRGGR